MFEINTAFLSKVLILKKFNKWWRQSCWARAKCSLWLQRLSPWSRWAGNETFGDINHLLILLPMFQWLCLWPGKGSDHQLLLGRSSGSPEKWLSSSEGQQVILSKLSLQALLYDKRNNLYPLSGCNHLYKKSNTTLEKVFLQRERCCATLWTWVHVFKVLTKETSKLYFQKDEVPGNQLSWEISHIWKKIQ